MNLQQRQKAIFADGRRGIAANGFKQQGTSLQAQFLKLFSHQQAAAFVGDHNRRRGIQSL